MKQKISLVVALCGIFMLFTPLLASANANNFVITSFDGKYYLSQDAEMRSTLRVEETLVAQFPDFDQNHGIERAIPNTYDGHSVSPEIQSVKKADGTDLPYTTYDSNSNTVVRIGSANKYVHGEQTYVIIYTLRDVTKNFDNGDEFYWDINGTEWEQSFGSVSATVFVDDSIVSRLDGHLRCITGTAGITEKACKIAENQKVINAQTTNSLSSGENMTILVGFQPGTFAPYKGIEFPLWVLILGLFVFVALYVLLPVWLLVWGVRKWRAAGRDKSQVHTIVPEYLPPKKMPIMQADIIIHATKRPVAVSATVIDLALRHYLKIYEVDKKEYELEITQPIYDLPLDDRRVVDLLFGTSPNIGDSIALKDKNNLYSKVTEIGDESYAVAILAGYMVDTRSLQKRMYWIAGGSLALSIFTFNILLFIAAVVVLIVAGYMPARTEKGVGMKAYLDGLKMYMEVAEEERIKLLQTPETAAKINYEDKGQLVKLYERLLPYAMLYGIEKQWAKQFADLYTLDTQPEWYSGNYTAFNAASFASAMSSFGTVSQTSFSPPTSSGSSGFSGGGGLSGGGGGGGGGGGW